MIKKILSLSLLSLAINSVTFADTNANPPSQCPGGFPITCDCNTFFVYVKNNSSKTWKSTHSSMTHGTYSSFITELKPGETQFYKTYARDYFGPDMTTTFTDGEKTATIHAQQNYCVMKGGQITTSAIAPFVHTRDEKAEWFPFGKSRPGITYFEINNS